MAAARQDAVRNRELIVRCARTAQEEGRPLRLNDVARRAGVGVGTVYRHFPTSEQLAAALATDRVRELTDAAGVAARSADGGAALRDFLRLALTALAADDALAEVLLSPAAGSAERDALVAAYGRLVDRSDVRLRAGLDRADLLVVLCGLAHALRLARPRTVEPYLDAVLDGALAAD